MNRMIEESNDEKDVKELRLEGRGWDREKELWRDNAFQRRQVRKFWGARVFNGFYCEI